MMNREIKFRVWHPMFGMGKPVDIWQMTSFCYNNGKGIKVLEKHYDPECIFLQYTGLKDKNGKEIYEGDIVVLDTFPEWGFRNARGVVEYIGSGFWVETWSLNGRPENKREVVGNIYENT